MKTLLFGLLTASLVIGGTVAESRVAAQQMGTITGALSYPSDFDFPRMIVCAEAVSLKSIHCTGKRTLNRRRGKLTYQLRVPAGSYYVFATIVNEEASVGDYRGYKAYYSDFVICGLSVNCPSHAPVKVTVRAGRTTTGVDPGDWYADQRR